jgi:VanZ family protein
VFLIAAIGLMGAIGVLSLVPGEPLPGDSALVWFVAETPATVQNVMHVVCYAVLAALWMKWLSSSGSTRSRLLALTVAISYGALLEAGQLMVPGRFGSVSDALLNALGAVAGVLILVRLSLVRDSDAVSPDS